LELAQGEADEEDALETPIYDFEDDIWRCKRCAWEVVEGTCQSPICGKEYKFDPEEDCTESLVSDALHPDRTLVKRGVTPTKHLYDFNVPPPPLYLQVSARATNRDPKDEYRALLERGATLEMCETFHLEYTDEKGIVALATQLIQEEFSGPAMKSTDKWKIHLGRCIKLDRDDPHGSIFIEGLLEDAILFPLRSEKSGRKFERWETVKEGPGVWVTRLMENRDEAMDDKADDESDARDLNLEYDRLLQKWDEELENSERVDNGPVGLVDACGSRGFMFVDPDEEDEYEDEEESGNSSHNDSDEDMLFDSEAAEKPDAVWMERNVADDLAGGFEQDSDDMPGSDWDSDEELSGDDLDGLNHIGIVYKY